MSFKGTWLTRRGDTAEITDKDGNAWKGRIIHPFVSPIMYWDENGDVLGDAPPDFDLMERISERTRK